MSKYEMERRICDQCGDSVDKPKEMAFGAQDPFYDWIVLTLSPAGRVTKDFCSYGCMDGWLAAQNTDGLPDIETVAVDTLTQYAIEIKGTKTFSKDERQDIGNWARYLADKIRKGEKPSPRELVASLIICENNAEPSEPLNVPLGAISFDEDGDAAAFTVDMVGFGHEYAGKTLHVSIAKRIAQ